ncbi:DUF2975 domain-containing protein [Qipengyuania gaetbuli]|uniref:DUF2975 domain-containing protein n=1 Tax=Qipengyuania gaetbuli TaxID=266952 RepID=UPI001C99E359|nr:DUF2975 domain-containing protein [Qipengyuania gaetbuli]MBY6015539.1 DUF2975 domain-containing protein [Qipengyuania gaetbuli]
MTARPKDPLLLSGKVIALLLQGLSALAVVILISLIVLLVLISQDVLDAIADYDDFTLLQRAPVFYFALPVLLSVISAAFFAFFGKMRRIIESVSEGDPFIAENAQRLSSMAWLLLGVQALALLVGFVRLHLANLESDGSDRLDFSVYDLEGLVMVLVLFILARVFRHGAAMRADLEGTV